jgi:hypothetical protein
MFIIDIIYLLWALRPGTYPGEAAAFFPSRNSVCFILEYPLAPLRKNV